jgi:hypothetical protein
VAQISAIDRQRILTLMTREVETNGLLDKVDRDELTALQKLAGLVRRWAAGLLGATLPNSMQRSPSQRSMDHHQRQLELAAMRYPRPLSGRQAIVALWRERMDWDLTPRQAALQRMKERWT